MTCRLSTGRADPPTASRSSPSIEPGHRAGFCRFRSFPMAEFFTHFSCLLDVGTPDNAACGLELYLAFAEEVEREEIGDVGFVLSIQPEHGGTQLWMRGDVNRPEERWCGNECVLPCQSGWLRDHNKK